MPASTRLTRGSLLTAFVVSLAFVGGCGGDTNTTSALPPSANAPAPPPPDPKAAGKGGPKSSSAAYDSALGGTPPK